jgi:hypothetical protein
MALQPLSHAEFLRLQRTDKYYVGRWPYLSAASSLIQRLEPQTILELGPYRRPLFAGSHVMDRRSQLHSGTADVVWDATKTPWPVDDKAYDLFVALQVWEHLGPCQAEAFNEVRRISRRAVLSFPLQWKMPNHADCHHGITMAKIREWTTTPTRTVVVDKPAPTRKRAICFYQF